MLTFFTTIDYIGVLRLLIDFTVLATLIYWLLYFLRGTKSANILIGVICLFCVIGILADWLQLQVLRYLLARIWTILGVAIVVIFQPELHVPTTSTKDVPFSIIEFSNAFLIAFLSFLTDAGFCADCLVT